VNLNVVFTFALRKQKGWKKRRLHEIGKKQQEGKKKRKNAKKKKKKRNGKLRRNVNKKKRSGAGWLWCLWLVFRELLGISISNRV
jgi:hypothetical protein